jgi:RloB-like protein
MTSRSRGGSRRPSNQAERLQLRVFCEGQKTESVYLTNWHRLNRSHVIISIAAHEHTTPFELAESAASQRRSDLREARRGRGSAFSQYWCVFDVDEHPKVAEALELARANAINVALSSPCLELWFLIHFENRTAYLDRREAQKRSKAALGCGKSLTPTALDLLVTNYDTAKARAQALEVKHVGDEASLPWNPYSDMWKLIDTIKADPVVT